MAGFEYDLAYEVADLVTRTERLLDKLGHHWIRNDGVRCSEDPRAELSVTLSSGHRVRVAIGPLPPERQTHTLFFPRALLTADSDDADDHEVAALRHAFVVALLRVAG
ncbi:MAG: hypothetical protein HYR72_13560 [Deltaproteobacteria bacterium]|nr:hypothetical protein [Deltaproteobacteria bacterium]MBI3391199.1 hypothetical protein [Deltaproteobacteria bacterium]